MLVIFSVYLVLYMLFHVMPFGNIYIFLLNNKQHIWCAIWCKKFSILLEFSLNFQNRGFGNLIVTPAAPCLNN